MKSVAEFSITADARIDGRDDLIAKLPHAPRTESDAELILLAYQTWGEDCVKHLHGDFAFKIWDNCSQRLFCARDHFGVKPFFYARVEDSFLFSSRLNELRADPRISDALNETAIGDYLVFGLNQDLSTTTFRDIQRLPPAHSLTMNNGSIAIRRYWTPDTSKEVRFRNRNEYVERFSELLHQAVRDRLGDHRVAVSMSGGLDSTSLAAIAQDAGADVHACAVVYDQLIPDEERYYATAAANHLGIPVSYVTADRYSLFDEQVPGDLDQPEPFLLSPLTAQFHTLLRLCAAHSGIALTGYDGDAFMNEPKRRLGQYRNAVASGKRLVSTLVRMFDPTLSRYGTDPSQVRISGSQPALPEWIDELFARRTNLHERLQQSWNNPVNPVQKRPAAMRALNSKVWAPLFEGYDPGATKLNLEVRHPFTDVRLVEYLLAIPRAPWCVNKHILRVAMKDRLPAVVLNRPKTPLAGSPALQIARDTSVRWLDSFEVNPQLERFVNLSKRRSIADEVTPDAFWASLRVFALNYWLTRLPANRSTNDGQQNQAYQTSIA